ncbi:MAG: DUF6133 family protein [Ethanoligenens sp.]
MRFLKNKAAAVYAGVLTKSLLLLSAKADFKANIKAAISNNKGEGFVDMGVGILIAVVIGALVLAGLYALFGNTILPTLTRKIQDLFNYAG